MILTSFGWLEDTSGGARDAFSAFQEGNVAGTAEAETGLMFFQTSMKQIEPASDAGSTNRSQI